jgi:hypothetical protein
MRPQCKKTSRAYAAEEKTLLRLKSAKQFTSFDVDKETYKQNFVIFCSVAGCSFSFLNMRTRAKYTSYPQIILTGYSV